MNLLNPPSRVLSRFLIVENGIVLAAALVGVYGYRVGEPWWADAAVMASVWCVAIMSRQIRFADFRDFLETPIDQVQAWRSLAVERRQSVLLARQTILCCGLAVIYFLGWGKYSLSAAFLLFGAYEFWGCVRARSRYTRAIQD